MLLLKPRQLIQSFHPHTQTYLPHINFTPEEDVDWIHISLARTCWAQAPRSNPQWQIHTTTMSPPAARHTNTRDAGAGRSPWFFLQLQRHGYTNCLCKRHPAQNQLDRNRRATETILACSTDEIPSKCLRWIHSSASLLDSPFFLPATHHMAICQANCSLISCKN